MKTRNPSERVAVAEIVATLLLIAIAVLAAVVAYGFFTGFFGGLTSGGPSRLVSGTGQMNVPGTSDSTGVLTLNLRNDGSSVIQSIVVSCSTSYFAFPQCANPPFTMYYQPPLMPPMPVSAANPLPVGSTATGTASVAACLVSPCLTPFTSGTSYVVTMVVTFVGGSTQSVAVNVPSSS